MNKELNIVIPSRERADWLMKRKRHTLKQVSHLKPKLYVREDDTQFISYQHMAKKYMCEMISYEDQNILGAAQTYDMIIDEYIELGYEHLIILDDDLKMSMHNPILGAKPDFKICTPYEIDELLWQAVALVDEKTPLISFTPIMSRRKPHLVSFCKPIMMAYVYYLPHFKNNPTHRFWMGEGIEARCDLNLSLKMLTEGFLTGWMTSLFIPDNVNNPGGCSIYRDLAMEEKSIDHLIKNFGEFLTIRTKKGWINDPDINRRAATIRWKKSFNKKLFKERFNIDAIDYCKNKISSYEKIYTDFIKESRK